MRIVVVSPYDLGVPGGVQSHVVLLARALRATGDDVVVIGPGEHTGADAPARDGPPPAGSALAASRSGASRPARTRSTGGSVRIPFNGSVAPVGLGPLSGLRTRRLLAALRPDVVHVHEPLVPAVGLAAATSSVAPVVGTFHAWSSQDRAYRAVRPVGRRVLDRLAAAIAVSPAAANYHAGALGVPVTRFEVVPNGVDTARFAHAAADFHDGPDPSDAQVSRHDGVDPSDAQVSRRPDAAADFHDGPDPSDAQVSRRPDAEEEETLLFVGRLEPRKGLATLIRAFIALRPSRPGLRLTVVGEGSEHDRCARLLPDTWREDVRFVGRAEDDALVGHFAAADIYVSPALGGESFGIVLLEAMAAGRPVIASDIPGYRSVVTPGRDAELVVPDDPGALAAAIGALLDDPVRRHAMVTAGKETATAHDWTVVADRLREVYARAIAGG